MADLKGLKRICMSCGSRFYDLNKKPIVCPSCKVEFTGEIKVKARRGRLTNDDAPDEPVLGDEVVEVEVEEVEREEDTVSLDDIEEDPKDLEEEAEGILDEDLAIDEDIDDLDEDIVEDIEEEK